MRTSRAPSWFQLAHVVAASFILFAVSAFGKGGGVGFWMEGTLTNITVTGDRIQFQLTGRFWMEQFPDGRPPRQLIEVDCKRGVSATVSQAEPFFAMTSDWHGGAIRQKGALLKILKAAAEHGRVVRFQMLQPKLEFGRDGSFTLTDAAVIRATDADLR
ncbi:MAG: hypothetical protein FJ387_26565 [Verrucomicrobia bacterium]|nr:hypothetical protein [Verrucomicrobiota bacterium]